MSTKSINGCAMEEESVFGLRPEQLDRLLSLGTDDEPAETEKHDADASSAEGNLAFGGGGRDETGQSSRVTASLSAMVEQPGGWIGRYRLLSVLGEGGMGIVYLARQEEPIRRQVALKIIKLGMDTKNVIARFEAERQALALLDHPNIAHIHDAGSTEGGRPYFVMEYVKGLPITEHCDKHKFTIEERLRLFQQICDAVQHAHQKGIIHRDLKPSNILVFPGRDKAIPKIIDFGVAKAIAQPLTQRTLVTEQGQLFGTPEYMSPEQADMANEDIDTRSDIYSLGVLLYVLLTGVLPFEPDRLREGGIEHIRQVIREIDPKTPSARLTKLGEAAKKIAESRRTRAETLARRLRKELEWIPLKAMRKERAERYRSASELADDIENYLKGNPLIAGPPVIVYRLKKFVRRNAALSSAVAAAVVCLAVGLITTTAMYVQADHARAEAQAVSGFLRNSVLASLDPFKVGGKEITIRSVLDAASESLEGDFEGTPLAEAEIQDTLGNAYWSLGLYKQAELHLKRALDIQLIQRGIEHPATLASAHQLGWVNFAQSRYPEAEQFLSQVRETRCRLWGEAHLDTLYSTMGLACVYNMQGRFQEAERLVKEALKTTRDALGEEHWYVPGFMNILSWNYNLQGRYNEAEQVAERGLKIARGTLGENHWFTLLLKNTLGQTCGLLGRYDEAERHLLDTLDSRREARGEEHPDTLETMACLGWLYHAQGHYEVAETQLANALKIARRVLGDKHLTTVNCAYELGAVHLSQGRCDEAKPLLEEALEITDDVLGEKNWYTPRIMNTLARLHKAQGRPDAESLFNEALDVRLSKFGRDHPETLESKNDLSVLYKEQGNFDKAEPLLLEALESRRLKLGDTHPHTLESWHNLINLYEAWNKPERANEWRAKLPPTEAVRE